MINLDTNLLVRYITQDDPDAAARAGDVIENRLTDRTPGFLTLIGLVELCWVLRRLYRADEAQVRSTVAALLETSFLVVERSELVAEALRLPQAELADALLHLVGRAHGANKTVTFDHRFAHLHGVELLT